MARFKIGQKVVAIKNHSKGRFKRGQIFIVDGFSCCTKCGCSFISLKGFYEIVNCQCSTCKDIEQFVRQRYAEECFAPITNTADAIEYKMKVSIPELIEIKEVQLQ